MLVDKSFAKTFAFVILIIVGMSALIWPAGLAMAQTCTLPSGVQCVDGILQDGSGRACICNPLRWGTIQEIIEAIVNFLWYLSWILVPLLIVIGAFYIVTAGGSERRVSTGKKIIIYAVVGFMLVLFVRGIIGLVHGILGVT